MNKYLEKLTQWNKKIIARGLMGKVIFLLGCLIGILVFVLIYGIDLINPCNVGWLHQSVEIEDLWDLTQHYLGWCYYRKSPWTFPIGLIDGLTTDPISIAYTDSIPLFAIFFKLLSPILPEEFQYFGIFGILCYALTGGAGGHVVYSLLIRFRNKDCRTDGPSNNASEKSSNGFNKENCDLLISEIIIILISAGLFALSPVLLKRMFYHTALSAHFLLVMAFDLWVMRDGMSRRKYRSFFTLLAVVATLINPYFTPMILGILLCACLQELLSSEQKKKSLLEIGKVLLSCGIFIILAAWCEGIFYGNVSASGSSLDVLSFNLNQFFNPSNYLLHIEHRDYIWYTQNYSAFLSELPLVSGNQEEGFSYLGLGMILLLLLVILLLFVQAIKVVVYRNRTNVKVENQLQNKHRDTKELESKKEATKEKDNRVKPLLISLAVCLLVFTFLAMSPSGTIDDKILYQLDLPNVLYNAWSVFRSTGRMIWPVYYLLYLLLIYGVYRIIKNKKTVTILLIIVFVLQVIDLQPALQYKQENYQSAAKQSSDYQYIQIGNQSNIENITDQISDSTYLPYRDHDLDGLGQVEVLKDASWDILGENSTKIIFYEPVQYSIYCDPGYACVFTEYAYLYNLSLNVTYLSRDISEKTNQDTAEHFLERYQGKSFPDIIYVFSDISDIPSAKLTGLNYYIIDNYIIGTELEL